MAEKRGLRNGNYHPIIHTYTCMHALLCFGLFVECLVNVWKKYLKTFFLYYLFSSLVDPCSSRDLVLDLWNNCDSSSSSSSPSRRRCCDPDFVGSYTFNVQQLKLPLKQKFVVGIRPANPANQEEEQSLSVKVSSSSSSQN